MKGRFLSTRIDATLTWTSHALTYLEYPGVSAAIAMQPFRAERCFMLQTARSASCRKFASKNEHEAPSLSADVGVNPSSRIAHLPREKAQLGRFFSSCGGYPSLRNPNPKHFDSRPSLSVSQSTSWSQARREESYWKC